MLLILARAQWDQKGNFVKAERKFNLVYIYYKFYALITLDSLFFNIL
jgi:hypothetical protein